MLPVGVAVQERRATQLHRCDSGVVSVAADEVLAQLLAWVLSPPAEPIIFGVINWSIWSSVFTNKLVWVLSPPAAGGSFTTGSFVAKRHAKLIALNVFRAKVRAIRTSIGSTAVWFL